MGARGGSGKVAQPATGLSAFGLWATFPDPPRYALVYL